MIFMEIFVLKKVGKKFKFFFVFSKIVKEILSYLQKELLCRQ